MFNSNMLHTKLFGLSLKLYDKKVHSKQSRSTHSKHWRTNLHTIHVERTHSKQNIINCLVIIKSFRVRQTRTILKRNSRRLVRVSELNNLKKTEIKKTCSVERFRPRASQHRLSLRPALYYTLGRNFELSVLYIKLTTVICTIL